MPDFEARCYPDRDRHARSHGAAMAGAAGMPARSGYGLYASESCRLRIALHRDKRSGLFLPAECAGSEFSIEGREAIRPFA